MTVSVRYDRTYRRTLLDMHIPDWEPEFLAAYDPEALAELYATSHISGVLFYCKSHMGLNYWPSPVGAIHPAAAKRDLVGEMANALRARNIAPAAYHSVIFDNWAVEAHPDWSIVPATALEGKNVQAHGPRYGTACLNHPGYRAYENAQITALLERYEFDALWIDMAFWPAVCICEHCRERYRGETGDEIPVVVDWTRPAWARFQSARERWLKEWTLELFDVAHAVRPGLPVTHNLAPGAIGWITAEKIDWGLEDSFAAGDIYGGKDEQLLISKLMLHVSKHQPAEFMTSRTPRIYNHTSLKSEQRMLVEVLAATAHASAFLFIDAIDPRGTVNPGVYEQIGRVFAKTKRYEGFLGGLPVEDVAIYYADDARVRPEDNGHALAEVTADTFSQVGTYPHVVTLSGAVRHLQHDHVPFGAITRSQLDRLTEYRVVILPDVVRMDDEEIEGLRAYVAAGGSLYASGRTSLLGTDGILRPDFGLADVFGVHVDRTEDGHGVYSRALDPLIAEAVHPESHLAYGFGPGHEMSGRPPIGMPRLSLEHSGQVLARLTLPYGYPSAGSISAHDFASIHASPPWQDLDNPTIVFNRYGDGQVVYSALPIEMGSSDADQRAFSKLVRLLLGGPQTLAAEAHPDVWVTAFEQPEHNRAVISVLGYFVDAPMRFPVRFSYRDRAERRCVAVQEAASGSGVPFEADDDGTVRVSIDAVDGFGMYIVIYD
jgi:Alpha-L-fucosidase